MSKKLTDWGAFVFPESLNKLGKGGIRGTTLKEIILPNTITSLDGMTAFNDALEVLTLETPTVVESNLSGRELSKNIRAILVPEDLVASYKTENGWKHYAPIIVAIGTDVSNFPILGPYVYKVNFINYDQFIDDEPEWPASLDRMENDPFNNTLTLSNDSKMITSATVDTTSVTLKVAADKASVTIGGKMPAKDITIKIVIADRPPKLYDLSIPANEGYQTASESSKQLPILEKLKEGEVLDIPEIVISDFIENRFESVTVDGGNGKITAEINAAETTITVSGTMPPNNVTISATVKPAGSL